MKNSIEKSFGQLNPQEKKEENKIMSDDKCFRQVDEKGRVFLPQEFTKDFPEKLVLMRGQECLVLLAEEEWNELMEERISGLEGAELRRVKRALGSSAFDIEIGSQGRISIPLPLREYGSLMSKENVVVIKLPNHLEIWNKENWQKKKNQGVKEEKK